ncbi:hypothetical protein N7524_007607 [Penicillium chrysogenum]|nr:hypothetical protein N7524_007607 [Penicillium chrysogenum]
MQLNKCLILLATCATTAFSVAVPDATAADECSNLGGVMSMEAHKLPEGVSLSDLRKCVEHPHGRERFLDEASLAPFEEGDAPSDEKKLQLISRLVAWRSELLTRATLLRLTAARRATAGRLAVTTVNGAGLRTRPGWGWGVWGLRLLDAS